VARLCGLHRDLRGLSVADFAEQDDVGVLPQDRSQRAGERQLDLFVDLRLVDAGIWYSTGSSMVMMLVFSDCTAFSAELSVVVLPLPVGPTTRIIPC